MTDVPRVRRKRAKELKRLDTDVLTLARERVAYIYDTFDHVCVAFSGGKDSTVVLQLALEEAHRRGRLPLDVGFYDEEAVAPQTVEYVRRVYNRDDVAMRWYTVPIRCNNGCSAKHPHWYPWAPEVENLWVRPKPAEGIELPGYEPAVTDVALRRDHTQLKGLEFPWREYPQVAYLMGIRALESLMRLGGILRRVNAAEAFVTHEPAATKHGSAGRSEVARKSAETYSWGNIWKCYPIYDWRRSDVWTACAKFGWDYSAAYDVMEMAGVGETFQRVAPAFANESTLQLDMWAKCFPETWARMVNRVPGVQAAARYARTELWAWGSLPPKPPDEAWPDFLKRQIRKRPEGEQFDLARRIEREVNNHAQKTPDPILEVPHPFTGCSWHFLLTLAVRGDPKERRQAYHEFRNSDPDRFPTMVREYEALLGRPCTRPKGG